MRAAVLERDKHTCRNCRVVFASAELDVHHLIPRKHGGADDPANLVTLCDSCHAACHPNVQVGLARRAIERAAVTIAKLLDRSNELPDDLTRLTAALHVLGKTGFREGQLEVILAALRGESVLVVRPTGFGKSLCFQVPALMTPGTTLVLSPLKALMNDQVGGLQQLKVPASFINSDLAPAEKESRYQLLEAGVLKLVYCAPERFNEELVRPEEVERILAIRPSFLVVDEAHCIDRWGDAFRPDYSRIGNLRERLGNPPVLAFTATAGIDTQRRILASLGVPEARRVVSDVDRPNIALIRHRIPGFADRRARFIAPLLRGLDEGRAMIFVPTRKKGDALQEELRRRGIDLPFFHAAAWTATEREMVMNRFTGKLDPPLNAIICTNAFGMGIDVPDVRLVIHWQHPASVEDYLQEFGRAGRDGRPAAAILLSDASPDWEVGLLKFMVEKTIDSSALRGGAANDASDLRFRQIDQINALVHNDRGCFRRQLTDALGNEARGRQKMAVRILERVFSQRRRVTPAGVCCDACDRKAASRILLGDFSALA